MNYLAAVVGIADGLSRGDDRDRPTDAAVGLNNLSENRDQRCDEAVPGQPTRPEATAGSACRAFGAGRCANLVQVLQGLQAGDRIITSEIGEWQGQDRILLK